ncbi:MAG: hypothetical protein ACPHCN_09350 [Mycobacterium sp.]
MALLTRQERRSLPPEERKSLRKQRRDARRELRKMERAERLEDRDEKKWGLVLAVAKPIMVELWDEVMPGPEKMDEVLDHVVEEAAEHADDMLTWSWLESLGAIGRACAKAFESADGEVARVLLRWLLKKPLQRLYERVKVELEGE